MEKTTSRKLTQLQEMLRKMKHVAIAFSGGVDSTFLVKIAYDVLGTNVVAVTAVSPTYPQWELKEAQNLAQTIGVPHTILQSKEMNDPHFTKNTKNRCYYCKKELFVEIKKLAAKKNITYILDGSTIDDTFDYRPGEKAIQELQIISPLKQVGLTKTEIRKLSKQLGLPTWDKPSFACLASRFPYGTKLTKSRLNQVEQAETLLQSLGIEQFRVRYHDKLARIEVPQKDFQLILKHSKTIVNQFKKLGFTYITLDITGYRSGSMNEVLKL